MRACAGSPLPRSPRSSPPPRRRAARAAGCSAPRTPHVTAWGVTALATERRNRSTARSTLIAFRRAETRPPARREVARRGPRRAVVARADRGRDREAPGRDRGRRPTRQFAIVVDGRPVGMIQTYLVSDHPSGPSSWTSRTGAAGVDLLIGEPDLVGGGLGPRVLAEFARYVVFADSAGARSSPGRGANRRSCARSRRPASFTFATSRRTASRAG